jgi:adenylate cyclase
MDTLIRLVVAERGFLMLPNEQGELVTRMARNWEQESVSPSDFALSTTIISQVGSERKPILTTNASQDPRFGKQDSIMAHNLRSIMCVPMVVKAALIGVIYVDNRIRSGIFTRTKLDLLTGFANQAAVAIENARLFASVRRTLNEVTGFKT